MRARPVPPADTGAVPAAVRGVAPGPVHGVVPRVVPGVVPRVVPGVVVAAVAAALLAGCSSGTGPSGSGSAGKHSFTVVTDIYPTTFAVEQVAGDEVEVIQLAPAGVEPHDYELSPAQVAQVADADLVAYLPGMIPAVAAAVARVGAERSVDVSTGVTRLTPTGSESSPEASGATDPHVWLDPRNMAAMGRTAADALDAAGIPADAADLTSRMTALDDAARTDLARCAIKPMVVNHAAFGYLANAYGFEQVAISGLSPDAEPSPRRMAQIADLVRQQGVTTIYFESLASPAAAKAIAAETGAQTALLDPIEGNTGDAGYEQLMRSNVAALRTGQECS